MATFFKEKGFSLVESFFKLFMAKTTRGGIEEGQKRDRGGIEEGQGRGRAGIGVGQKRDKALAAVLVTYELRGSAYHPEC